MGVSRVVAAGVPLGGPDTPPRDVHPSSASDEASGSGVLEPLAVGMSDPLYWHGTECPANTAAYAGPPSIGRGCPLVPTVTSSAADCAVYPSTPSHWAPCSGLMRKVWSGKLGAFPFSRMCAAAVCGRTEPNPQPRWKASPCWTQGLSALSRRNGLPQLQDKSWGMLKRGVSLHKSQFPLFQHSALSRGSYISITLHPVIHLMIRKETAKNSRCKSTAVQQWGQCSQALS
jgi:hypothetical protein